MTSFEKFLRLTRTDAELRGRVENLLMAGAMDDVQILAKEYGFDCNTEELSEWEPCLPLPHDEF